MRDSRRGGEPMLGHSRALKLGWQIACLCLLGIFVPALVTSLGYSLTDALGPGPGFFPFWLSLIGAVLSAAMLAQVTLAKADAGSAISLVPDSLAPDGLVPGRQVAL